MSMEKLKRAMQLIQECIDEYQGEEAEEGDMSSDDSYDDSIDSDSESMSGNDKVKMAAALMKRA